MTRQYIGARYVPKFYNGSDGSNWDANVVYEPLTIVQYLTNAYCSKKTVPATVGAPNLNTEYWANIGLYSDVNTRIDNLAIQVNSLSNDLSSFEVEVNENFDEIEEQLRTLGDYVDVTKFGAVPDAKYWDRTTNSWWKTEEKTEVPTNNAQAIQDAIDYAIANDIGIVYFPKGNYYTVNKTFEINASAISLVGCGNSQLISTGLSNGSNFINIVSGPTLKQYEYPRSPLKDISIRGNYMIDDCSVLSKGILVTGVSYGYGEYPEGTVVSPDCILTNVNITGFGIGLNLASAYKSGATNLSIIACTIGIRIDNNSSNAAVPWTGFMVHVTCCSLGIHGGIGYNTLQIIGGAFEYNRTNYRGSGKVYFVNTRFEFDILSACDASLNAISPFLIAEGGTSQLQFIGCQFLVLPNFATNVGFYIPNPYVVQSTNQTIFFVYNPDRKQTSLMFNGCTMTLNQESNTNYIVNPVNITMEQCDIICSNCTWAINNESSVLPTNYVAIGPTTPVYGISKEGNLIGIIGNHTGTVTITQEFIVNGEVVRSRVAGEIVCNTAATQVACMLAEGYNFIKLTSDTAGGASFAVTII